MHFDALTLACVVQELTGQLVEGRIQNVVMPDERAVGLEIYANRTRHYLLCHTGEPTGRLHLVDFKLRRGVEGASPLLLLLRKFARGARIQEVRQWSPIERVACLELEHPEHGPSTLVVELVGRRSNVVLLDGEGTIRDCLVRVPPSERAQRLLLPGHVYQEPPPQEGLLPWDDGSTDYYQRLAALVQKPGPLWRTLVSGVAGMSPTLAREVAWRACGRADAAATDAEPLAVIQALQALWAPVREGGWEPGLVFDDGQLWGFAPYHLHFRGRFQPTTSMSEALARFFLAGPGADRPPDPYAGLRGEVAAQLRRARERLTRQLEALQGDEPAPGEAEALRTQAQWLLALASQIQPGQDRLDVDLGEEILSIPLRPDLSPVAQAERMFRQAAKLERAALVIPQRRAALEADLTYLDQLETDLALAEDQPAIAAVQEELRATGLAAARGKQPRTHARSQEGAPLRLRTGDGWEILVGRNARQNDAVTFRLSHPDDLWCHVRDLPGAHVVIRSQGRPVPPVVVEAAARVAAYFSRARDERAVPVAVTRRRFVSRQPGGRPGQVYYRQEETLVVPATLPDSLLPA